MYSASRERPENVTRTRLRRTEEEPASDRNAEFRLRNALQVLATVPTQQQAAAMVALLVCPSNDADADAAAAAADVTMATSKIYDILPRRRQNTVHIRRRFPHFPVTDFLVYFTVPL